jgi:hypothetical protein
VEGAEAQVLKTIDLARHRPRVLVIEATLPGSGLKSWDEPEANGSWAEWEGGLLEAGYAFALFDGLNRFYLRREDHGLAIRLALPPGVYDGLDCSQGPQSQAAERLELIERQHQEIEDLRISRDEAVAVAGRAADAAQISEALAKLKEGSAATEQRLSDNANRLTLLEDRQHVLETLSVESMHRSRLSEEERSAREEVISGLQAQVLTLSLELQQRLNVIEALSAELANSQAFNANLAKVEADRVARGSNYRSAGPDHGYRTRKRTTARSDHSA